MKTGQRAVHSIKEPLPGRLCPNVVYSGQRGQSQEGRRSEQNKGISGPLASSQKGTASSHKLQHETDSHCRRGHHPPWLGQAAKLQQSLVTQTPATYPPGESYLPKLSTAHWGSETTPGSTNRSSGEQRGKGICSVHMVYQGWSWRRGREKVL